MKRKRTVTKAAAKQAARSCSAGPATGSAPGRTPARAPAPSARRTEAERALAERMLQRLRGGDDVRGRKVRRIRAAIKVRHYENGLKLAIALDRLARAATRLRA